MEVQRPAKKSQVDLEALERYIPKNGLLLQVIFMLTFPAEAMSAGSGRSGFPLQRQSCLV
jgi:hypothetical protein